MKPYEHGGNVYTAGIYNPAVVDFSANINPLGISKAVEKAITDNINNLVHYPDPSGIKLKQVISVNYSVRPEQIILGNGAVELLYLYFHSKRPESVLIPVPSFSEYERAARAAGCHVEYLYLDKTQQFNLDIDMLLERLPDYDVVIVGNPNNPTGGLLDRTDIISVLELAEQNNTCVIMDESFLDFLPDGQCYSVMELTDNYKGLFVIRSMTKFYAIPGLRLGFGIGHQRLVNSLEMGKDPWNVNLLAQAAGVAALEDKEYRERSRELVGKCIEEMYGALKNIRQLSVYPPSVNFILTSVEKTGLTSGAFTEKMAERGYLVRDCGNYPGLDEYHVRLAVRQTRENLELIQTIKDVLG